MKPEDVAKPARSVVATSRFERDFAHYAKGYPGIATLVEDFVAFRQTNPTSKAWAKKDTPLVSNKYFKNIWHAHLVHGKVILIYAVTLDQLRLLAIVEHNDVEGGSKTCNGLGRWCQSLGPNDFRPWCAPKPAAEKLTPDEVHEIKNLVWELSGDERSIKRVADGDFGEFFELARLVINRDWPNAKIDRMALEAMGGSDALRREAKQIMRHTAVSVMEAGDGLPTWNPAEINPALMTLAEYLKLVDPQVKNHPEQAYDTTLAKLNQYGPKRETGRVIGRRKINGMMFEFRLFAEEIAYKHKDENGEWLRDANRDLIPMTKDEIRTKGLREHEYTVCVYDEEGQRVASAQDEWGAMLIMVAREYRGFGIGPMLGKLARTIEPAKSSGGFTASGRNNFVKVYREFVRDALTSGLYRDMIRKGDLTMNRVREIVASARLDIKPKRDTLNLDTSDPKDWLLYGEDGCFIIYDRKLEAIYKDHLYDWGERFIKGYVLTRIIETPRIGEVGLFVQFGGDTPAIKRFLIGLASSYCADEGVLLAIDPEDAPFIDRNFNEVTGPDMDTGYKRFYVRSLKNLDYKNLVRPEKAYRAKIDPYDEFKNVVLELAEAKFRSSGAMAESAQPLTEAEALIDKAKIERWHDEFTFMVPLTGGTGDETLMVRVSVEEHDDGSEELDVIDLYVKGAERHPESFPTSYPEKGQAFGVYGRGVRLSAASLRAVLRFILDTMRKHHGNITKITGRRITGARAGNGGKPTKAKVSEALDELERRWVGAAK